MNQLTRIGNVISVGMIEMASKFDYENLNDRNNKVIRVMTRDGDWRELDLYLEMLTRLFLISFHIIHRSEQGGADLLPRWGARVFWN